MSQSASQNAGLDHTIVATKASLRAAKERIETIEDSIGRKGANDEQEEEIARLQTQIKAQEKWLEARGQDAKGEETRANRRAVEEVMRDAEHAPRTSGK